MGVRTDTMHGVLTKIMRTTRPIMTKTKIRKDISVIATDLVFPTKGIVKGMTSTSVIFYAPIGERSLIALIVV